MNSDERRIRAGLAQIVDDTPPPADLAARVERNARRIIRRRTAAAMVAVAAVITVPVLTVGRIGDRPGPTATPPASACGAVTVGTLPPEAPATDPVNWPYRGDPTLRSLAVPQERADLRFTDVHPLLGVRLPGGDPLTISASRQLPGRTWMLEWQTPSAGGSHGLPRLGPDTQISMFVQVYSGRTGRLSVSNILVVLAAPDTDEISWTGCRAGTPVTVRAAGDVLVRDLAGLDSAGRLTVRAGDRITYSGTPTTAFAGQLPPTFRERVAPPLVTAPPVPAGYRPLFRLRQNDGENANLDAARATNPGGPEQWRLARVLVRCRGTGPATLTSSFGFSRELQCGPREQLHDVPVPMTVSPADPGIMFRLTAPDTATAAALSYDLAVVTPKS